jgi:hypothetical protein
MLRPRLHALITLPVLAGLLSSLTPVSAREVLVLDAAKPATVIVLGAEPTTAAQYGALELQLHLEQITGVKPEIVREPAEIKGVRLALGNTALARSLGFPVDKLPPWEFLVAEKSGVIVLAGGDAPVTEEANWNSLNHLFNGEPNGSALAVFEFLEECCGVHWYLPSEAGTVVPQTKRLVVQMAAPIRRRTDFRSTSFYPYQVNKNMFCRPARPELTGDNVPGDEMERWRRGLYSIPIKQADMLPVVEVQRWLLRNKVGGERYGPNHSFTHWLERFGKQHPDWFSYKSPEKIADLMAKHPNPQDLSNYFHQTGNPCLTAPGVFEQQMADIRDYFDSQAAGAKPAAPYHGTQGRFFGIVLNDNYAMCQCDLCKPLYNRPAVATPMWGGADGSASFYLWDFVNRAARDLRRTHPDKWIAGIAYHNYMPPPKDFTLEPNVAVTVCTYLGNWTAELRETAYSLIRAWRDQAKCQWLGTWEYSCYSAMRGYQPMFPRVAPRLLGEDVRKLYQLGVVAEFNEGEDRYGFADSSNSYAVWSNPIWLYLNYWTRMKMYDDTKRDVGKLLRDHYRLFYGPASQPLSRFFTRIEERITDPQLRGPETFTNERSWNGAVDWEVLFPPPVMKELRGYVDEATRLAAAEPYKTRVTWVREGFLEHVETEAAVYFEQKKQRPVPGMAHTISYATAQAPVIDGKGDDAAWAAAPLGAMNDWRSGKPPLADTTFRLTHDATNLYLLVRCAEPNVAKLKAECTQHDEDVFFDDCIELHVTGVADQSRTYQIIVNSQGVVEDLAYQRNEGGAMIGSKAWNCAGLKTAALVDAAGYTVELAVPLAEIGGAYTPGVRLTGNVCRERYAGGEGTQAVELQSWSVTPEGFGDPKHFGQILLTTGDGWHVFFGGDQPPAPVLYRVLKSTSEWKSTPEAISVTPMGDFARYAMNVAPDANLSGIKGAMGFKCDPPVSVSDHPYFEIRYRKPSREVFLQIVYNYVAADGSKQFNWFIFSPTGTAQLAPTTFIWKPGMGGDDKPAPAKIENVTVYAVIYDNKTPPDCQFDLYWVRLCRQTMQGDKPLITPAAGMH